jgi:hypothetical protein
VELSVTEPDIWTTEALKQYVDCRFECVERAVDKAEHLTETRDRSTRSTLGLGLTVATAAALGARGAGQPAHVIAPSESEPRTLRLMRECQHGGWWSP